MHGFWFIMCQIFFKIHFVQNVWRFSKGNHFLSNDVLGLKLKWICFPKINNFCYFIITYLITNLEKQSNIILAGAENLFPGKCSILMMFFILMPMKAKAGLRILVCWGDSFWLRSLPLFWLITWGLLSLQLLKLKY